MGRIVSIFSIIIFVCIIVIYSNIKKLSTYERQLQDKNSIIDALNDTLTIKKNKEGEYVSTITMYQTQSVKDFLSIQFKDNEIIELQKEIKKQKKELESIVQFQSEIKIDTIVMVIPDTITKTYDWKFDDPWILLTGKTSSIQTNFSLFITNKYTVVSKKQKDNLILEITNHNPYSITTKAIGYSVGIPKQKKFGIGASVGYGWFGKFQPYIGIGINYNLIEF